MKNKDHHKQRHSKNDLNKDPDFDLDTYLEEQSHQETTTPGEETARKNTYFIKNAALSISLVIASVLWYHNWSPAQAWSSMFGSNESVLTTGQTFTVPEINVHIPRIEIPAIPPIPAVPGIRSYSNSTQAPVLDISLTEYLSALKTKGFLDNQISTFSARQLYDSHIPVSYLEELNEAGYLGDLSFVYITNFYQNEIPVTYLDQLKAAGIYDKLSFVHITNYYQQKVPMEYLKKLNDAGYLVDLSFVHVTNYYQAGVTPEFLDELKETGLYEDLSFLDVIDLYQRENGN
ncbi:MAG: hypothetical protein WD059_00495 [Balneolaceae bacterium]